MGKRNGLVGKPEGKRSLAKPVCRWSNNIKRDHKEIGWNAIEWIHLAKNRCKWGFVGKRYCTFLFFLLLYRAF
jgi:hypothetical protein